MKKIVKLAIPLAATAACTLLVRQKRRHNRLSPAKTVVITGDDPAFDAAMTNVFLLKRIDNDHRLQIIRTLREYTDCPLNQLKALIDQGGFICGLTESDKDLLKVQLEALGCHVEVRRA